MKSRIGNCAKKESRPRMNAEPVIVRTSQRCATCCIQLPVVEVKAPSHKTRKSRKVNAAPKRRNTRYPKDVEVLSGSVGASECSGSATRARVLHRGMRILCSVNFTK